MRTDSCRTCGMDMQEFQRCHTCNEVVTMMCLTCNKTSDTKVHANCGPLDRAVILN